MFKYFKNQARKRHLKDKILHLLAVETGQCLAFSYAMGDERLIRELSAMVTVTRKKINILQQELKNL